MQILSPLIRFLFKLFVYNFLHAIASFFQTGCIVQINKLMFIFPMFSFANSKGKLFFLWIPIKKSKEKIYHIMYIHSSAMKLFSEKLYQVLNNEIQSQVIRFNPNLHSYEWWLSVDTTRIKPTSLKVLMRCYIKVFA